MGGVGLTRGNSRQIMPAEALRRCQGAEARSRVSRAIHARSRATKRGSRATYARSWATKRGLPATYARSWATKRWLPAMMSDSSADESCAVSGESADESQRRPKATTPRAAVSGPGAFSTHSRRDAASFDALGFHVDALGFHCSAHARAASAFRP